MIIPAFWLALIGLYAGLAFLTPGRRRRRPQAEAPRQPAPSWRRGTRGTAAPRQLAAPTSAELDFLRSQVEHLRTEVVVLSGAPPRQEKSRMRRQGTGLYADLPAPLRRQVREVRHVRHIRHPLGA